MADRLQKINFALNSIPNYNGDPNKLSNFISAVNTVYNLFATLNPPLDNFDKSITFLNIKSKVTDRALDSIKDLEIDNWNDLKTHLINTFKDKTNSVTIVNDILKIQHIKNPYKLLEITKEKFLCFKSRLSIEESDPGTKIVTIRFIEKLIVNNFISVIADPYRNNLATRNPQTLTDIEVLLQNDFQYLRQNNIPKPTVKQIPVTQSQKSNFPTGPVEIVPTQYQNKNPGNQRFAPRQMIKNAQNMKPTPMSIQTRQTLRQNNQRPGNYFNQQNKNFGTHQPNYSIEELHNTETCEENFEENEYNIAQASNDCNDYYLPETDTENYTEHENNFEQDSFLEIRPNLQEKS